MRVLGLINIQINNKLFIIKIQYKNKVVILEYLSYFWFVFDRKQVFYCNSKTICSELSPN